MNKKKTILHVINEMGYGGAEILLANVVNELTEFNHIICNIEREVDALPLGENTKSYNLGYKNILSAPRVIYKFLRIIKRENVSLIHSHLLLPTFISRLANYYCDKPLLFTIHSLLSKDAFEQNKISLWLEKLTYKKNHYTIAVSQTALDDYQRFIATGEKTTVLYNFVDNKFFQNEQKVDNRNQILKLIAVGNLRQPKNYPYLLEILKACKKELHLDIYGKGFLQQSLEILIARDGLPVSLKSSIQIHTVLNSYDLFVMASYYEGFGISLVEAMASGLPVLVSDIPVFREVAGDAAFYFSLNDPTDFSRKITEIQTLKREGKLIAYGERCRGRAKEIACKELYFKKIRSIYHDALAS